MRIRPLVFFVCLLWGGLAIAAPNFPALTGRIVDNAHILSAGTRQSLEQTLADYEAGTTNQVVVATIPSLQGDSIEDYGYQLGRHWQIGQKGKNNGVVLIVAPNERKVRIEVGYDLEPVLTDAVSSEIVHAIILPNFREGRMEQGVVDGTQAILSVLGGKGIPSHEIVHDVETPPPFQAILIVLSLILFMWLSITHPIIAWWLVSNSMRFGSSNVQSSGWGGVFSGGGGSFGGGGASGGW